MKIRNTYLYIIICLLFFLSIGLVFSKSIWFDESYTLALIRHDYFDIISILRDDMHPPLYFLSLKLFCQIFGYSLTVTKIFSVLGFLSTLLLGCTIIRKDYGQRAACVYEIFFANIPMVYYFSAQQRCYSWSIFWVTLCFLMGCRLMRRASVPDMLLFAGSFLCAAYNHIYALVAVAGIVCWIAVYLVWKKMYGRIALAGGIILAGYVPWLFVLFSQTRNALNNFWQTSLEPLSLLVFGVTILWFLCIIGTFVWRRAKNAKSPYAKAPYAKPPYVKPLSEQRAPLGSIREESRRRLCVAFAMYSILFVQIVGIAVSLIFRPIYIARYAAPLMGIFALFLTFCFVNVLDKGRRTILLCCILLFQYAGTVWLEYNPSWHDFQSKFAKAYSAQDVFLYTDSSFGVFSYYYPESRHICFYAQSWFRAFSNIDYRRAGDFPARAEAHTVWYVVNHKGTIPDWLVQNRRLKKEYSFRNDFNVFDVYSVSSG